MHVNGGIVCYYIGTLLETENDIDTHTNVTYVSWPDNHRESHLLSFNEVQRLYDFVG